MMKVVPTPGMRITGSICLAPGEYDFFGKNGLIIEASNVVIDGYGATLVGGYMKKDISSPGGGTSSSVNGNSNLNTGGSNDGNINGFDYGSRRNGDNAKELGYFGVGIMVKNQKNVIIKNLRFKGFDIGAYIAFCENITLENCDFSDCFTDPDWGWDDHGIHGGIYMEHTHYSTIRCCKAVNVWDALNMRYCNHNTVTGNIFSHTSDTGLKLWNSCYNTVNDNDFSYGIRIAPGEVHARDSCCVLIESGSNYNIFKRNNMTHGGDGLFIRVLNGWMSTNNLFEENDCSYANNNAIEAWADNNKYIRNIANYSSYGFWLGNSDNTVLIDNEVAYNGTMFHNAPEAFGNCGIAVVNGSGSHYLLEGNYIHDNNGPGIAIRYKKDYPSFHWIIQGNRIENNKNYNNYKGHGIYFKNARFITFGYNEFRGNEGENIFFDDNVSDVYYLKGGPEKQAPVKIGCDSPVIIAGKPVTFSVKDALNTRWDLGDGTVCEGSTVTHIYDKSGFYRLAVTCDNNQQASMDFMNVFVCEDAPFITLSPGKATVSGDAAEYLVEVDKDWRITGGGSLKITAVGGRQHEIVMNTGSIAFGKGLTLTGYFRFLTDSEPDWNKEMTGPVVCLYQDKNNYITYKPSFKFLDMFSYNESRNNWVKFRLDEGFEKVVHGRVNTINEIKISLETVDKGYTRVYLDALCIVPEQVREPAFVSLSKPSEVSRYPRVLHNGIISGGDPLAPVLGNQKLYGDITPRIIFTRNGFYQAEFGTKRIIDRVDVWLYENRTRTLNSRNEKIPGMVSIECLVDGQWVTVLETGNLKRNKNEFKFSPVLAEAVRARFTGEEAMAIYGFKVYNTAALTDVSISASTPNELTVDRFEVKLRKEINGNGNPLGDLIARVYALNEKGELSECLFESIIPEKEVVPGGITVIRAQLKGLESNKKYALALGQTETAKSRTEGDYYRWVAGHAGYNETFGIYTGGVTKKSDYDWGTGWLKVICDITTVDYSHDSDHVGTRFGLADMQYRYMTFTMPASTVILTDGIAAPGPGFKFSGGTLEIDLKGRTASCLYLWLDREGILLVDGKPCEVRAGFNRIERKFSGRILISPGDTTFTMYEVEVVSRDAI